MFSIIYFSVSILLRILLDPSQILILVLTFSSAGSLREYPESSLVFFTTTVMYFVLSRVLFRCNDYLKVFLDFYDLQWLKTVYFHRTFNLQEGGKSLPVTYLSYKKKKTCSTLLLVGNVTDILSFTYLQISFFFPYKLNVVPIRILRLYLSEVLSNLSHYCKGKWGTKIEFLSPFENFYTVLCGSVYEYQVLEIINSGSWHCSVQERQYPFIPGKCFSYTL